MRRAVAGGTIAVVAAAATVAAVMTLGGADSSSADQLGRGPAVLLPSDVAALAPALDEAAALTSVNATRAAAGGGGLRESACLAEAARLTAATFTTGSISSQVSRPADCAEPIAWELVRWGWVSGSDPTGAAQLRSAFARGDAGPSDLMSAQAAAAGMALDRNRDSQGRVEGFVLVWVVSG